jgi:hypothetical protein
MMEKDPNDRYQEPIEVAEALAEWADRPIALPATKEMPGLCPLVMSLTGHSLDKAGVNAPLARVLFGPGRSVFRGGSGSGVGYQSSGPGSNSGNSRSGEIHLEVSGPSSTARASGARTAPLSNRQDSTEVPFAAPASGTGSVVVVHAPRRTGLLIVIGILLGALFVGGAVAAYYLGRSSKDTRPVSGGTSTAPGEDDPLMAPSLTEVAISADEAPSHVGSVKVVQFLVKSAGGTANVYLNSTDDFKSAANFAAKISPAAIQESGKTKEAFEAEHKGRTIRVRGKIVKDAKQAGVYTDVRTAKQLLILPES